MNTDKQCICRCHTWSNSPNPCFYCANAHSFEGLTYTPQEPIKTYHCDACRTFINERIQPICCPECGSTDVRGPLDVADIAIIADCDEGGF